MCSWQVMQEYVCYDRCWLHSGAVARQFFMADSDKILSESVHRRSFIACGWQLCSVDSRTLLRVSVTSEWVYDFVAVPANKRQSRRDHDRSQPSSALISVACFRLISLSLGSSLTLSDSVRYCTATCPVLQCPTLPCRTVAYTLPYCFPCPLSYMTSHNAHYRTPAVRVDIALVLVLWPCDPTFTHRTWHPDLDTSTLTLRPWHLDLASQPLHTDLTPQTCSWPCSRTWLPDVASKPCTPTLHTDLAPWPCTSTKNPDLTPPT